MAVIRAEGRWRAKRRRGMTGWLLLPAFFIVGAAGGLVLGALPDLNLTERLDGATAPSPAVASVPAVTFPVCAGGKRVTCVVDGDTFWLDGTKIRIADINTPEVGQPACAAEAALGRQATSRMKELLSAGPFQLQGIDRDEDVYGRKLRIVERDGQSLGAILVAEGLAHSWRGHKESWC